MSVEVASITNAGIKIGGTAIPVIRIALKNWEDVENESEFWDIAQYVFNNSYGGVSTASFYTRIKDAVLNDAPANGTYTYGVNTGFQIQFSCTTNHISPILETQIIRYSALYYKGYMISTAHILTGYSDYEYNYLCILTDENYNLLKMSNSNQFPGIRVYSTFNMGATWNGDCVVASIQGGDLQNIYSSSSMHLIQWENIKDEITGEMDLQNKDPYGGPGGASGSGGGHGTFSGTSDSIGIPSLPTLSAVDTGFITLFNPSIGELKALANYMWSAGFDLETFKKLFADPMDAILGLSIVPVNVPNGSSKTITVGNISTGVSVTTASTQYVEVDCGSISVEEYWGAYLDYDPYTKAEIYLPYIGTHPLATDDIMGKSVHVVYHIDILSGACCAFVKCGNSVLYSFVGQCSCSIPITGNDWTNVVNGALSIAASIGTMVATGGASAPMAAATIASTAVNSMKPSVEKSGSMGGMGGMLGVQTPYLILSRPRQAIPKNQNAYIGYPSFITNQLKALVGYTEVEQIHLENIPATGEELIEIENILKKGVII